jgi:Tfp pilus assembly protein PilF
MRQAAEQAWHDREMEKCNELLERASRLAPADVGLLLQLGRIYGIRYNYAAAEDCFEKAIRLTPKKAEVLSAVALQSRDFYDTRLTERYARRALSEKDATPDALAKLAETLERLRRTEEAGNLVDRALQQDPHQPLALLVLARLAQQGKQLEKAEEILRSGLAKAPDEIKVKMYYELAAILDRQKRHDEAMSALLEAKAFLRRTSAPFFEHWQRSRKHAAQMREQLSAELFQQWSASADQLQPHHRLAFLCGHPRSGTTLLEQVLDSHSEIVSAEETTHFNDYVYAPLQRRHPKGAPIVQVLSQTPPEVLRSVRSDYFRASELCLGKDFRNEILIDKNPSLTLLIPPVARVFPEARFLIALRDPRDVCLSCFMQPFVPIQQVSSAYLSLETTADEYVALMSMWKTVAPLMKNPFLEVRYEDMVEDLEPVARRALEFLGVNWDERVLGFDTHARGKVVRSPTYADVTQKVFKRARGRWLNYQKYLEPHLSKLEPFVKTLGYE